MLQGEWLDLRDTFPRTPRVVVADDDWLNRDLLKTYLEAAGCEVYAYPDGEQAWESICTLDPDLALLDIQMPRLDGLSLCRRIKDDSLTRLVPVIIVTALDSEEERLRAIEAGANEFIGKPFNSVILLTRVRSLLRLKHLHDELEHRNRVLQQVLNRYVDKDIADIILTDPERYLRLGGETRDVTVLFADLRGFTQFSAAHAASLVVEAINLVFNELTQVVFKNGGTFDKYLGDAIMAFFGAPLARPDDAHRALATALEMQRRFSDLREKKEHQILQSLEGLGVGVHSGEAIVGNIGSERVMDYTVVGSTVNIARRLQEVARPGEILISERTYERAPGATVEGVARQTFPGLEEPLALFSLRGLKGCPGS